MPLYRVMIPDTFVDIEANSEADAESQIAAHISKYPPSHSESHIDFITWRNGETKDAEREGQADG